MRQLIFLVAMALINSKCSSDENPTPQATTQTEEPVITIHPSADPNIPFTLVWEENFDGDTLDMTFGILNWVTDAIWEFVAGETKNYSVIQTPIIV